MDAMSVDRHITIVASCIFMPALGRASGVLGRFRVNSENAATPRSGSASDSVVKRPLYALTTSMRASILPSMCSSRVLCQLATSKWSDRAKGHVLSPG